MTAPATFTESQFAQLLATIKESTARSAAQIVEAHAREAAQQRAVQEAAQAKELREMSSEQLGRRLDESLRQAFKLQSPSWRTRGVRSLFDA